MAKLKCQTSFLLKLFLINYIPATSSTCSVLILIYIFHSTWGTLTPDLWPYPKSRSPLALRGGSKSDLLAFGCSQSCHGRDVLCGLKCVWMFSMCILFVRLSVYVCIFLSIYIFVFLTLCVTLHLSLCSCVRILLYYAIYKYDFHLHSWVKMHFIYIAIWQCLGLEQTQAVPRPMIHTSLPNLHQWSNFQSANHCF